MGHFLTETVQDYDPMGRIKDYWQCTPLNCNSSMWAVLYNYDLAGDVTSWNHPAGFTITQSIDGARHIKQVTSSLSDSTHPGTLATGPNNSIQYTAWGAVSQLLNGCAGSGCIQLLETYHPNKRLQTDMVELGVTGTPASKGCRVYNFYPGSNPSSCAAPTGTTGNNGNVTGLYFNDNVNTTLSHTATYTYDSVNRLTAAAATGNSTYSKAYTYTGDGSTGQYGNISCTGGLPACVNFTYNVANNRITTSGYAYDLAGNVTGDGTYTYTWDAEARMTKVVNGGGTTISTQTYNALGQRVRE